MMNNDGHHVKKIKDAVRQAMEIAIPKLWCSIGKESIGYENWMKFLEVDNNMTECQKSVTL